jgi:hypothetical protein
MELPDPLDKATLGSHEGNVLPGAAYPLPFGFKPGYPRFNETFSRHHRS